MSNFILNTDRPIDKIAWLWEGEVELKFDSGDGTRWGSLLLNHNVGAQLFVQGIWTLDDWQNTWTFGVTKTDVLEGNRTTIYDGVCEADDQKVACYITAKAASTVTAKVRLWAFVCEDETKGLELNPNGGLSRNRFTINTDFKYPQLYKEGYVLPGQSVNYKFDAIPFVEVWYISQYTYGRYRPLQNAGFLVDVDPDYGSSVVQVYNDAAIFDPEESGMYDKFYYRVYEP